MPPASRAPARSTIRPLAVARTVGVIEALRKASEAEASPQIAAAQQALERRIRAYLPRGEVRVTLTDNRYTMISVRRLKREQRFDVRLHLMFADADDVIVRALASYIADNDRQASRVLGDFIDNNNDYVRGRARRAPKQVILTAGEHHDLRAIFDRLNARYFDNQIEAAITWGARAGRVRRRSSIKMGSYAVEDRLIRIHRSLDRAFVPAFFVDWIVFHEMLHQVHDIHVKNGRREFHSKAFLAAETQFEHYHEARRWEREHLDELLTY
ncbi:MAG: hypothetical protein R3B48_00675 [Kofleriaceae bacterium]